MDWLRRPTVTSRKRWIGSVGSGRSSGLVARPPKLRLLLALPALLLFGYGCIPQGQVVPHTPWL